MAVPIKDHLVNSSLCGTQMIAVSYIIHFFLNARNSRAPPPAINNRATGTRPAGARRPTNSAQPPHGDCHAVRPDRFFHLISVPASNHIEDHCDQNGDDEQKRSHDYKFRATQVPHIANLPIIEMKIRSGYPCQLPSPEIRVSVFEFLVRTPALIARQQRMMTSHIPAAPSPLETDCIMLASVNASVPRKMRTPHATETPIMAGSSRIKLFISRPLSKAIIGSRMRLHPGRENPGCSHSRCPAKRRARISRQPNCSGRKQPGPLHA